jgi:hypothetical protein
VVKIIDPFSAGEWTAWRGYGMDEYNRENVYEIALIVAYGVAKRYFVDTSFSAIEYRHRIKPQYRGGMECGTAGPAFFYKFPEKIGQERYGFSTEEVWEQQGWGDNPTSLLPAGCSRP